MSSVFRRHILSNWIGMVVPLLALLIIPTFASPLELAESSIEPRQSMTAGDSCDGSEGEWNCMVDSFQRCASGVWSFVQDCAAGTQCSPAGLTYEFYVEYADEDNDSTSPTVASSSAPTFSLPTNSVPTANIGFGLGHVNWLLVGALTAFWISWTWL
ncbi:hypothetical protein F5Y16DRAFT_7832 [Xylariaceae sp. FL0255]|nr:hypothetical protein F5Y16DRAFT_7832 [Xylariaceae sp. FL0255]